MSIELRPVESDADVEAWLHVRRVVLPNESAGTVEQFRGRESGRISSCCSPRLDGAVVGQRHRRALGRAGPRVRRASRAPRGAAARGRHRAASRRSPSTSPGSASTGSARTSSTTARAPSPSASGSRRSTGRSSRSGAARVPAAESARRRRGRHDRRASGAARGRVPAREGGLGGLRHRRGGDDLARGLRPRGRHAARGLVRRPRRRRDRRLLGALRRATTTASPRTG